jgi:hypothetical protein
VIEIQEWDFFQYVYLWFNRGGKHNPEENYMRIQLYAQMLGWA